MEHILSWQAASAWLALMIVLSVYAWFGYRHALILPALAVATAIAGWAITGTPRTTLPPPGHYTILGARIDVDKAIYALMDDGNGEPVFYVLPYTTSSANALQAAMDGGNGVRAEVGTEGGVAYDGEPPVSDSEHKQAEQPQLNVGG